MKHSIFRVWTHFPDQENLAFLESRPNFHLLLTKFPLNVTSKYYGPNEYFCLFATGILLTFALWFVEAHPLPSSPSPVNAERHVYVFTASWCGPCHKMRERVWPKVKDVVDTYKSKQEMDVDDTKRKQFVDYYKVVELPCVLLVDDKGYELKRKVGYLTINQLREFLK